MNRDYHIVFEFDKDKLVSSVLGMIESGYKPLGNVQVIRYEITHPKDGGIEVIREFYQAVYKEGVL